MGKLAWQSVVGGKRWAVEVQRTDSGQLTYQAQEFKHERDRKPTKRYDFRRFQQAIEFCERMREDRL